MTRRRIYLRSLVALSSLVVVIGLLAGLTSLVGGHWLRGLAFVCCALLVRTAIGVVVRRELD